jgi:hypothetical protein
MPTKPETVQAPKNVAKFDKPTLVRRDSAVRFLWGDPRRISSATSSMDEASSTMIRQKS